MWPGISKQVQLGAFLLSFLLASAVVFGQVGSPSAPIPAEPPIPTIKATTRLVQLSVVVLDRRGQSISGLTKDAFTVLDAGEPQKISLFAQQGDDTKVAPASKPLPEGVYTNRLELKGQVPGSVTVVLLDTLNTPLEDQSYARTQIVKFLKQLQPRDHVAIYALTSKLEIVHDFTQDIDELIAAVGRYQGRASGQLSASEKPPGDVKSGPPTLSGSPAAAAVNQQFQQIQKLLDNVEQDREAMAVTNRSEVTLSAIEAIARHLGPVSGRKNLVWVSGSFPLAISQDEPTQDNATRGTANFEKQLERAARALNQANLAIYPVDARGLMAAVNYNAIDPQRFTPGQAPVFNRDTSDFASMDRLAERTGGRSFHNNNDLAGIVRAALSDGQITYQLAFYPTHGKWDGKFHEIKVRVKQQDLQLRYRKGYFATQESPNDSADRGAEIAAAAASPIEATSLSMLAQMYAPEKDKPDQFGIGILLNAREIDFADTPTGKSGMVDFVFIERDASGKQLSGEQKHVEFAPDQKKYESLVQTGLLVTNHIKIQRGIALLKIVVRDERSGAIGSVSIPLAVNPAPKSK